MQVTIHITEEDLSNLKDAAENWYDNEEMAAAIYGGTATSLMRLVIYEAEKTKE